MTYQEFLNRFTSLKMGVEDHAKYSYNFAEFFQNQLQVSKDRVIVEFYSPDATHLGKSGTTIAELRK